VKITSALAALSVGAAMLTIPLASATADIPGCTATDAQIYQPPTTVTGEPGDILACHPTGLPFVVGAPTLRAYKLQYVTTDAKGNKVAATGTVAVPTAAWTGSGSRPTVAYAPFTHGSGSACSLSKQMANGFQDQFESPIIGGLLSQGWALAATDGVGYMDGQTHYYTNGKANGPALLDIVRASRKLPQDALASDSKVALTGYSEGGNTSLWAAQLAASYAPELNVVGDASGGIPADLKAAAAQLNGGIFAGFLADALMGFKNQYPEMPFAELENDAGRAAEKTVTSQCLIGTVLSFLGARVENYSTQGLSLDQIYALQGPGGVTWGQIVDSLKLGVDVGTAASTAKYKIGFPVFQYRGLLEEVLPISAEDAVAKSYCQAGIPTSYKQYPGEHALTLFEGAGDVQNFIADRFAGKPFTPSGC